MILDQNEQVCSLELARKLQQLGVRQDSLLKHWMEHPATGMNTIPRSQIELAAYSISELGTIITESLKDVFAFAIITEVFQTEKLRYRVQLRCEVGHMGSAVADTEADARAKLLIHLIEEKIIDPLKLDMEATANREG
jgi:hypothetical protein